MLNFDPVSCATDLWYVDYDMLHFDESIVFKHKYSHVQVYRGHHLCSVSRYCPDVERAILYHAILDL